MVHEKDWNSLGFIAGRSPCCQHEPLVIVDENNPRNTIFLQLFGAC
jgi:hypothetical protein